MTGPFFWAGFRGALFGLRRQTEPRDGFTASRGKPKLALTATIQN